MSFKCHSYERAKTFHGKDISYGPYGQAYEQAEKKKTTIKKIREKKKDRRRKIGKKIGERRARKEKMRRMRKREMEKTEKKRKWILSRDKEIG